MSAAPVHALRAHRVSEAPLVFSFEGYGAVGRCQRGRLPATAPVASRTPFPAVATASTIVASADPAGPASSGIAVADTARAACAAGVPVVAATHTSVPTRPPVAGPGPVVAANPIAAIAAPPATAISFVIAAGVRSTRITVPVALGSRARSRSALRPPFERPFGTRRVESVSNNEDIVQPFNARSRYGDENQKRDLAGRHRKIPLRRLVARNDDALRFSVNNLCLKDDVVAPHRHLEEPGIFHLHRTHLAALEVEHRRPVDRYLHLYRPRDGIAKRNDPWSRGVLRQRCCLHRGD